MIALERSSGCLPPPPTSRPRPIPPRRVRDHHDRTGQSCRVTTCHLIVQQTPLTIARYSASKRGQLRSDSGPDCAVALLGLDDVAENAQTGDLDLDLVTGLQEDLRVAAISHSTRRAGQDDVAR